ncbi:MAG: DUF6232 family protein [Hyphomicrobiaceae bacterium]
MLSGARALAGRLFDPVSGRQEFDEIYVYERVLDAGGRTIAVDSIATVSVDAATYRIVRWLCWALAAAAAILSLNGFISSWLIVSSSGWAHATVFAVSSVGYATFAVGLFFLGRRFRDSPILVIGASDGTRTIFRCRDEQYLQEAKSVLGRKIDEGDRNLTLVLNFKDAHSYPIAQAVHGAPQMRSDRSFMPAQGQRIADARGQNLRLNGHAAHAVPHDAAPVARSSSGTRMPVERGQHSGRTTTILIDFTQVLPQIVELQRFYAQHPDMRHIDQRLSEMELLMRAGAATHQQKGRVRSLALDLGEILQTYPAMTQLFGHIIRMVDG